MPGYITADEFLAQWAYGVDMSPLRLPAFALRAMIETFISTTKVDMDLYMGQSLDVNTITDFRMDGTGTRDMVVPFMPIRTVTKCEVYYGFGNLLYAFQKIRHTASRKLNLAGDAPDVACDLIVDRDRGLLRINPGSYTLLQQGGQSLSPLWTYIFTLGPRNINMSLDIGYSVIPADIKAAQGMLVAINMGEAAAGRQSGGASSVRIGSVSRSWANRSYQSLFNFYQDQAEKIMNFYSVRTETA